MTINIADNNPRVSYSVSAGVTQTSFAVPFEFFDETDILVYIDSTLKTLNTDYTVSGGDGTTGTITMSVTGPATVALVRDVTIERSTDFPTAGPFSVQSLNVELDKQIAIDADISDQIDRAVRSPIEEFTTMTLPDAATRADKLLKFDTAGNVAVESATALVSGAVVGANFVNNTFTGNGSQTAFTTTVEAGSKNNAQVYIDGVYQLKSSFSVSGTTLTFTEAPPLNAQIEVIIGKALTSVTGDASGMDYTQGSTGSVQRTVESKLQEFVSVKDFGAVGDGVTDDTAAIQAAFNTGSKHIKFPDGTYYCPSWTVFTSTTDRMLLSGKGTIQGDDTAAFIKPSTSIELDGLTFKNWTLVLDNDIADSGTLDILNINNCTIRDCARGFSLERPINNARINNNTFKNITNGAAIRIGLNDYSYQDTWKNMVVANNNFININASGSTDAVAALLYGKSAVIADNVIEDVDASGTGESWGIYTKVRYATVSGNSIREITTSGTGAVYAINIKGRPRGDTSAPQGYSTTVTGNAVTCSVTSEGTGIRSQNDDVIITGNTVEGFDVGINSQTDGYDNNVISNNSVYGFGSIGINLIQSGNNITCTGNSIQNSGSGTGIRMASSLAASNYNISNNSIYNISTGILVDNVNTVNNVSITGNVIDTITTRAITFDTCNNIAIKNNLIRNQTANVTQTVWQTGDCGNFDIADNGFVTMQTTGTGSAANNLQIFNVSSDDAEAIVVEVKCTGRKTDGTDHATYHISGLYSLESGTLTQIGSTQKIFEIESDATWNDTALLTSSNDILIRLGGKAATTIDWVASVNIRSVSAN